MMESDTISQNKYQSKAGQNLRPDIYHDKNKNYVVYIV